MIDQHKVLPKKLFPFMWYFLKNHKSVVCIYIFLGIATGFWAPFNSILIKQLIDLLPEIAGGDTTPLMFAAGLIVVNFIIFDNVTWRGIAYITATFIPKLINRIIAEITNAVLKKSSDFYQNTLSGKLSKHITNLGDGIEAIINGIMPSFLRGSSLLITAIITSYFVNSIFCYVLIIWFILFSTLSILMSKKLVSLSDTQASTESSVVGQLVDTLSNHSTVRIFSRYAYEKLKLIPFLNEQQTAYTATHMYSLIMRIVQGVLIAIMMAFSFYFLIYLYQKNLVTIGDFALIGGLSMETGHTMWFTMTEVDAFNKARGKCKQSLTSLLITADIQDKPNPSILTCPYGGITFNTVSFHYKNTENFFENISIDIKPGQKVGLVGYSGGGKSTFVNLILRLYDVTHGGILIDGQDIRDVTQESLQENIAMIPQDPSLFHRSLMDNIRYGRLNATDDEVIEAAKRAHAHEFIIKLPQGYQSLVGERGIKLSGGQRQRIAMARAIIKNAPILILDEATSQLDSVTENLIQDSLWTLMQGKTTVIIAHRLSTLLHMDRILVFDQGKIVEDGNHVELINTNGLYKTLWSMQNGDFLGDK